ncbi:hypothetical protein ABID95_006738 [Streptomyces atratus]
MCQNCLCQVVVGEGRRPARTPLVDVQAEAGVPAGRWTAAGSSCLVGPGEEEATPQPRRDVHGDIIQSLERDWPLPRGSHLRCCCVAD